MTERAAQPEEGPEATLGDEGGLSPSPLSPQSPGEASGPGLLGASRRPRISLCAVMRSISQLESPEPPELPGEPLAGEVSAGRGRAGQGGAAVLPEPPPHFCVSPPPGVCGRGGVGGCPPGDTALLPAPPRGAPGQPGWRSRPRL